MRNLMFLFVLILVVIVSLGFYQGWFHLSTDSGDQSPSATITVDNEKILQDEQSVKETIHNLGQETKESTGQTTDEVEKSKNQP